MICSVIDKRSLKECSRDAIFRVMMQFFGRGIHAVTDVQVETEAVVCRVHWAELKLINYLGATAKTQIGNYFRARGLGEPDWKKTDLIFRDLKGGGKVKPVSIFPPDYLVTCKCGKKIHLLSTVNEDLSGMLCDCGARWSYSLGDRIAFVNEGLS